MEVALLFLLVERGVDALRLLVERGVRFFVEDEDVLRATLDGVNNVLRGGGLRAEDMLRGGLPAKEVLLGLRAEDDGVKVAPFC